MQNKYSFMGFWGGGYCHLSAAEGRVFKVRVSSK